MPFGLYVPLIVSIERVFDFWDISSMDPFFQLDFTSNCRSARIAEAAADRLRSTPPVGGAEISCTCEDGMLCLHGKVSTFYAKQVAQEAVKNLEGLAGIINHIEVT